MKSIIALFLIATLPAPLYLKAQEKEYSKYPSCNKVRVGLRTGIYFSSFHIQSRYNASFTGDAMYYAGVQLQIPVAPKLYINPEILYAASSVTYHDNQFGGTILASDDISHILIPVQLKYQLGKLGLYAGVQAAILTSARATVIQVYKDLNVTDSSYKKTGFSGVAGAEFVFSYRFGIDARYNWNFSNMRASNGSTAMTDNGTVKMSAFETGLFFRFGKKPKRTK